MCSSSQEIVTKLLSEEKKPAAATLPNDGTMGMMQRPKRLSILTTCKTCLLSIKEHLLNLLTQRNNLQKKFTLPLYIPREEEQVGRGERSEVASSGRGVVGRAAAKTCPSR